MNRWLVSVSLSRAALGHVDFPNFKYSAIKIDDRPVDVYAPHCSNAKSPIILSLHAWATSSDMEEHVDRLPEYAGSECAIIAYPQGKSHGLMGLIGYSWNAGGCCPGANTARVDDVTFLGDVASAIAKQFNADGSQLFVVGVSNGGMMANRLACTNERVKALVAVAGPLMNGTGQTDQFPCNRSVPMLHMHGSADEVVPWIGCREGDGQKPCHAMAAMPGFPQLPWPTVPDAVGDWRVRNGMARDAQGAISFQNGSTACTTWGQVDNNVTLCKVDKEGHAWPGSCSIATSLPGMHCSHDMDGSAATMEFFRRYMNPRRSVVVV